MNGTDAATVKLEFDLFWLTTAGQNPAEMLRKYANRAVLVHLKGYSPAGQARSARSGHFVTGNCFAWAFRWSATKIVPGNARTARSPR